MEIRDPGAEWCLNKLIRIGDVYGFRGDRLGQWPIFNCPDALQWGPRGSRDADAALAAAQEVQSCSIWQDTKTTASWVGQGTADQSGRKHTIANFSCLILSTTFEAFPEERKKHNSETPNCIKILQFVKGKKLKWVNTRNGSLCWSSAIPCNYSQ